MEMNRIDALIANPNIYYDSEAVEGFIRYCENELTLTDGRDLHLLPSFKLWAEQIFGWYYFVERSVYVPYARAIMVVDYVKKTIKKRLTTKQYLIVARGAAKSMYAACIQALLPQCRHVNYASDHHRSDHEAGRRSDVAVPYGHH